MLAAKVHVRLVNGPAEALRKTFSALPEAVAS